MKMVRSSSHTSRLYPRNVPGTHFHWELSRPHGHGAVGRSMSLKNPVTPPGIDPGTLRLVAQRLNHYVTPDPLGYSVRRRIGNVTAWKPTSLNCSLPLFNPQKQFQPAVASGDHAFPQIAFSGFAWFSEQIMTFFSLNSVGPVV